MKVRLPLVIKMLSLLVVVVCSNQSQAALTDGLIVHFDFETVSNSSVYDLSHHNNLGTLLGNPSVVPGKTGYGMSFPTASDYLQMPVDLLNAQTSFSVATWVKVSSLSTWSRIFDFGSGMQYYLFLTPLSGSGTVRFAIKNGAGRNSSMHLRP